MEPIGFIGVGAMGSSIASRLVGSHTLLVSDKIRTAADELVAEGAKFATVDEIAESCHVVFLCLPGPSNVMDLLFGPAGLADRLTPGSVVIDTTSSIPSVDDKVLAALRERQVDYADSPIAGGVRRAREGTATLMVGAAPEVFARIAPLLGVVTSEVIHVGPVGTGHAMKLVNNLLNACNRYAALETIRLGEAAGVERDVILQVINKGSGRNYATEYTFPQLLSGDSYQLQGFTLALWLKDIRLANELADDLGHETPIGDLVEAFTQQAIDRFGPDADQSEMMAKWYQN
jgi:3-hydroxyisobutyrate dehydrogenase-like beta-hydroxyacid dehydrogenase